MEWNGLILLKKTRFEQRSWYNISKGESDFSREEFMVRVPWSSTFQKIQLQVRNLNPIRFTSQNLILILTVLLVSYSVLVKW